MAQTKVKLISDGVIVQGNLHASHGITTAHIGEGSNLYYTDARVGSYLSTNSFATESYVGTQIANLVDSSPSALNTLNELAAALGDDANFSTTITNSIALKAPLASPSFTGNATFAGSVTVSGISSTLNTGNSGTFVTNDANDYPRISTASANIQLGLFRTSTGSGGVYIGGFSGGFEVRNGSTLAPIFNVDQSGNGTFAGNVTVNGEARVYTGSNFGYWGVDAGNSYVYLGTNSSAYGLSLQTAGTERLRINSSGNVGIGVSPSTSRLKVSGANTSGTPLVDLRASGTGSFQRGVRLLNTGMNAGDHIMYAVGRSDNSRNMGQTYFYYAGDGSTSNRISMGLHSVDDVFNIAGTGNVGIGATNPFSKLTVSKAGINEGSISFDDQANNAHLTLAGSDAYVRLQMGTYNNGSYGAWIQSSYDNGGVNYGTEPLILNPQGGNVGIGTTSPLGKLHVSTGSDGNNGNIEFIIGGTNGSNARTGRIIKNTTSPYQMTIKASDWSGGNFLILDASAVGIGNTSPDEKLEISGTGSLYPNIKFSFPGVTSRYMKIGMATAVKYEFEVNGSGTYMVFKTEGVERMQINSTYVKIAQDKQLRIGDYFHLGSGNSSYMGSIGFNRDTSNGAIFNSSYGAYQMHNYQGTLKLQVYSSAGGTIGEHKFFNNGDVSLLKGISFNGDTASANLLDDYEEGTWTPAVSGDTVAGTTTYSGSNSQRGSYTKIGNQVTCWFSILNFGQSGASGHFKISGLPFTCSMDDSVRGAFSGNLRFYKINFPNGYDLPSINLDDNTSHFYILWSRDNNTWVNQDVTNNTNQYIEGYVTYTTA